MMKHGPYDLVADDLDDAVTKRYYGWSLCLMTLGFSLGIIAIGLIVFLRQYWMVICALMGLGVGGVSVGFVRRLRRLVWMRKKQK